MRHSSGRLWRAVAEFAPETNQRESIGGNPVRDARKFNYPNQIRICLLLLPRLCSGPHAPAQLRRLRADGPSPRPPSRGTKTGNRGARPRSRASGVAGAAACRKSVARRQGNTRGLPSPSFRASSRICIARPHSGTRCSRLAFMRAGGTVHTASVRLISTHSAHRTSLHLAAVSTRNSNARRTAGSASDVRAASICRSHLAMRQRPQVLHHVMLWPQHRAEPVAGVVGPELHRHRPLQHRPDPPPDVAR